MEGVCPTQVLTQPREPRFQILWAGGIVKHHMHSQISFAHLLMKHLSEDSRMEEGEEVFCLQLQREIELANTAGFFTKKLGNLETEGHLRQGPAAGVFPCLLPRSC